MKKLAAISIAVSICATFLGIGQRATAWTRIITRTKDYSTPTYYDENSVRRKGDVVLVRISANNQVGLLALSCSQAMLATSVNGKNFDSPRRISPSTSAAILYHMFCHLGQQSLTTQPDANRFVAEQALKEGLRLYQQGTTESLQKAIKKLQQARSLWRQMDNKKAEAYSLNLIGLVYSSLGKKQQALEYYTQALPLLRVSGDGGGHAEASLLTSIGTLYDDLGEKEKALSFYNQALPLDRAVRDRAGEATTLNHIGIVYRSLGENQKALSIFNQALPLSRVENDLSGEARTLNNIAIVYSDLGERQQALNYYKQVLARVKEPRDKAITFNNIGILYSYLGDNQNALKCYNKGLPLSRAAGDRALEATILQNIGTIHSESKNQSKSNNKSESNNQKALENYNQALQLLQAVGDHQGEANTLSNIGAVYSNWGDKQKALEYYNKALPIKRKVGDKRGEATTLNNIGKVNYDLGDKQKALKYYNRAMTLIREVGDKDQEATTLSNIGIIYRDTRQPTLAIKTLEKSVSIILKLRSGVGRENRKTFLESEQGTPITLVNLLIDQNQPERAFEWANLATVADLADYSRFVKAKVDNPEAQKALDQWNQKNLQLESLQKQLQQKFTPELSQRVNQQQEQLNREGEDIRNRFTEAADLFETKPTDIAQLQASIPVGTTVIQPVLLTNVNTIALFILTKDKLKVIKVPIDPAKFDAILKQTYTSLINRFDDKYIDNLEKLYEELIRPVEAEIQATNPKQLSFIATGKLRDIPFEALYDEKTDKYLIQKYPISYLTSLSTRSLKVGGMRKPASAKKILAFGNPVTKKPLALPGAEAEVKSITQIFPGSEAYINSQATLDQFKIQSPRFSLLHLATHGCFQKGGCPQLGLEENTLLFADQKYNIADAALLGLQNVDLITLSACQTALETNSNGEEIAGLAYLFERAGSRSVIASLWSAEDETTKAIMVQFYQNLKKGMSKGEALRQAKLSQINNDGVLPHPFFWSPFVLIGDAG